MITLTTERLWLRPRVVDEAAVTRRLWEERDPRVPAHRRIDAQGRPSIADIEATIRDDPGMLLSVVRRDTGGVIGYAGLVAGGHGSEQEPELAFELLRAEQGRGFGTEAGRAVVAHADELGHPRLWAGVRDWNVASRTVLARLGFRETGDVVPDPVHGDDVLMVREAVTTSGS